MMFLRIHHFDSVMPKWERQLDDLIYRSGMSVWCRNSNHADFKCNDIVENTHEYRGNITVDKMFSFTYQIDSTSIPKNYSNAKHSLIRASCELWIKNRRDEGMKWQLGMTGVM